MRYLAYFALPATLVATINEPPRLELLSGYRNDLIHWHLTQGDIFLSSERARNIQFWQNALLFDCIHRDIACSAKAGYGAFGRGELKERLAFAGATPDFTFFTHGWAVDGATFLGYAVNLTPDRTYRVALIPLAGFSGHYQVMQRPGAQTVHINSSEMTSSFPKPYQQTWYGPYIGGEFRIDPSSCLFFEIGYAYHWLHVRVSSQTKQRLDTITSMDKLTLSRWGNFGHSGWGQMQIGLTRSWRIGLALDIEYYFSGKHPVNVTQSAGEFSVEVSETFKLRWFSISAFANVSKRF